MSPLHLAGRSVLSGPHLVGRSALSPPHLVGRSVLARSATTGWGQSSLRNLRQENLEFLPEVAVVKLLDTLDGVDLRHRLVVPDAHDAREPKRIAAGMPVRALDRVERHL